MSKEEISIEKVKCLCEDMIKVVKASAETEKLIDDWKPVIYTCVVAGIVMDIVKKSEQKKGI